MIGISQKDADEVLNVLGCYAVSTGKRLRMLRRSVLSPSSGFNSLLGLLILNMETPALLRNFGNYLQVNTA
jgi:hypothetical protein